MLSNRMKPVLLDDMVLQGNGHDSFSAFDRKTGNLIWQKKIDGGVEAGAVTDGKYVYFGANGNYFYSLDLVNGKERWKFSARAAIFSKPKLYNGVIYFLSGDNKLYDLNAETGEKLWHYSRIDTANINVRGGSTPAAYGNRVYVGFSDGYLLALNRADGGVVWERQINTSIRFRDVDASPVIDEKRIYISGYDDSLYALSLEDGQIIWKIKEGGYTSVLIDGSRIFYSTSNGKLLCIDKASGKVQWQYKFNDSVGTKPASLKELLVVGESNGSLLFLTKDNAKLIDTFNPGKGLNAEAAVDSKRGEVYFISNAAVLYALRAGWQQKEFGFSWQD